MDREPISYERARDQHRVYQKTLVELGLTVITLPGDPDFPDSVFVEDNAIVTDEVAILCRSGAESRQGEPDRIAPLLGQFRPIERIEAPGTVDGGDVLRMGKKVYVGQATRSNPEAVEQMQKILGRHGYTVVGVPTTGCLHLKTGATQVGPETILLNPEWVDRAHFNGYRIIESDPSEPFACNCLFAGGTVVVPAAFPKTRATLEQAGCKTVTVPADELAKAEGGLTCSSILLKI